ncbi:hypothetical protein, partial [Shewanella algae]|uniref:hypothetical protein n=1 Tax=Shewanella algae TaxID=38313 RepID=UPI00313BBDF3
EVQITQGYAASGSSSTAVIRINGSQVGTTTYANNNSALGLNITSVRVGYSAFTTGNANTASAYNNPNYMPQAYTSTFSADFDDWYVLD